MRRRNRLCGGVGGNVLGEYSGNVPGRGLMPLPGTSGRAVSRSTATRGRSLSRELLDLDACAGLFELGLDLVGLVLRDALLDGCRSTVDDVLGLLEAEPGDRAHDLDHLDLLVAGRRQDDVERVLLLGRTRVAAATRRRSSCNRDRSGGRDAPLLLDCVLQLDELEHGHLAE